MISRGDVVSVSLPGKYGKPRPAVVVQSDFFQGHTSVTLLPITGELVDAPLIRHTLQPDAGNGLQKISQVMIDKAHTLPAERIGEPFGHLDEQAMRDISRLLAFFLGIAK